MKIIHISYSDLSGGAAVAAYRIHKSLISIGVNSEMWVEKAVSGDWRVKTYQSKWKRIIDIMKKFFSGRVIKLLKSGNKILHSPAIFSSALVKKINESDASLINLHWVQNEMFSVSDISRIKKPIVWTLHDMWAFCGAEHYTEEYRWKVGYENYNRPDYERGFDVNKWTWKRKKKLWKNGIPIVTPSIWLGDCVKNSNLMSKWPTTIIPYPINNLVWKSMEKKLARNFLNLPENKTLLLFGAMGGSIDPRKGFDLLKESLHFIKNNENNIELVVFGQSSPKSPPELGFPIHFVGHLNDEISLRILYSAADLMIIPSRQDNLPNTGLEAQVCGLPVVAFNIGGMPDIVAHEKTGYLAKPFDTNDLAYGISWILSDLSLYSSIQENSRKRAIELWSEEIVGKKYITLYESVIKNH
jgi:glycosyltransferase involved in cell wall biosynthesis